MNPALNGSLVIRRAIERRDGLTFDFYTGLPHIAIPQCISLAIKLIKQV